MVYIELSRLLNGNPFDLELYQRASAIERSQGNGNGAIDTNQELGAVSLGLNDRQRNRLMGMLNSGGPQLPPPSQNHRPGSNYGHNQRPGSNFPTPPPVNHRPGTYVPPPVLVVPVHVAYEYFFQKFPGSGPETKERAMRYAQRAATGEFGEFEAFKTSYAWFFNKLPGNGLDTQLKAIDLAADAARSPGGLPVISRAYEVLYNALPGSGEETAKEAMRLAFEVARQSPGRVDELKPTFDVFFRRAPSGDFGRRQALFLALEKIGVYTL